MSDISPQLLEAIKTAFDKNLNADKKALDLLKIINDGSGTYIQAQQYAGRVGQALADAFSSCISSDILPDGKMYQNIAEKIMLPMLKENYRLVSKASVTVQNNLNKEAEIGLKAQTAAFDSERATNLVHKVSSYSNYDDAAWVLREPIKDFTVCVADNTLKKNAEFQAKSGLSPVIVRKAESKCCKWCSNLAGVYRYPNNVPKDVYLRHDNCRCTVDYRPGNGKRQHIHTGTEGKRKYVKDEYGDYQLRKEVRVAKAKEMASTEAARKAAAREKRIETWRKKKASSLQVENRINSNKEYSQMYRPVTRGYESSFSSGTVKNIQARKVDSYNSKIFVSNNAVIKPKAMHTINKNTDEALKYYGIDLNKKPTIIIVSEKEMVTALGKYNAIKNEVYYIPQIADNKVVSHLGSVEYHEMYHCKQAHDFIQSTGQGITADNYSEYIKYTCEKSKEQLDKLGINEYNVGKISDYAENKYLNGRFDEAIAEFIVSEYKRKRGVL